MPRKLFNIFYFIKVHKMKEGDIPILKSFKKGIRLDEYLGQMKINKDDNEEKVEEDLFQTSRKIQGSHSKKLITYEIREIDEENYDESAEQPEKQLEKLHKLSTNFNLPEERQSNGRINFSKTELNRQSLNGRGFRVRNQSHSPYIQTKKQSSLSPNRNLAKTLYNNDWNVQEERKGAAGSSTLYGQFLKGIKEKKNEKYFRKKNIKELDYVLKYEQNINSKYNNYNKGDFRVDGISDRLHERKTFKFLK